MTTLIVAKGLDEGRFFEIFTARNVIPMRVLETKKIDLDEDGHKENTIWVMEDDVAERAATEISRWNPGVEVSVFKMTEVFFRPAGELIRRVVTKDGVLPA